MSGASPAPHRAPLAGGGEIAYREAGSGAPLVLVHGNFASSRWWTPQLGAPPADARLLAPDLPGFGASPARPGAITIGGYADALLAFLDALGIERAPLVGHSLGGAVVQAAAAAAPDRIAALLLIDSAAPHGLATPEDRYPLLEALHGNADAMGAALGPTLTSPATPTPPAFFGELVGDALGMDPAAFSGNARALGAMDLTERARELAGAFPVTVLRGAHDPLIGDADARATAEAWGGELAVWDDAGHSPQLEHPDRFAPLLAALVATGDA